MSTFLRFASIGCFLLASINGFGDDAPRALGWISTGLIAGFAASWNKENN